MSENNNNENLGGDPTDEEEFISPYEYIDYFLTVGRYRVAANIGRYRKDEGSFGMLSEDDENDPEWVPMAPQVVWEKFMEFADESHFLVKMSLLPFPGEKYLSTPAFWFEGYEPPDEEDQTADPNLDWMRYTDGVWCSPDSVSPLAYQEMVECVRQAVAEIHRLKKAPGSLAPSLKGEGDESTPPMIPLALSVDGGALDLYIQREILEAPDIPVVRDMMKPHFLKVKYVLVSGAYDDSFIQMGPYNREGKRTGNVGDFYTKLVSANRYLTTSGSNYRLMPNYQTSANLLKGTVFAQEGKKPMLAPNHYKDCGDVSVIQGERRLIIRDLLLSLHNPEVVPNLQSVQMAQGKKILPPYLDSIKRLDEAYLAKVRKNSSFGTVHVELYTAFLAAHNEKRRIVNLPSGWTGLVGQDLSIDWAPTADLAVKEATEETLLRHKDKLLKVGVLLEGAAHWERVTPGLAQSREWYLAVEGTQMGFSSSPLLLPKDPIPLSIAKSILKPFRSGGVVVRFHENPHLNVASQIVVTIDKISQKKVLMSSKEISLGALSEKGKTKARQDIGKIQSEILTEEEKLGRLRAQLDDLPHPGEASERSAKAAREAARLRGAYGGSSKGEPPKSGSSSSSSLLSSSSSSSLSLMPLPLSSSSSSEGKSNLEDSEIELFAAYQKDKKKGEGTFSAYNTMFKGLSSDGTTGGGILDGLLGSFPGQDPHLGPPWK